MYTNSHGFECSLDLDFSKYLAMFSENTRIMPPYNIVRTCTSPKIECWKWNRCILNNGLCAVAKVLAVLD